jgi:hypothetical protein
MQVIMDYSYLAPKKRVRLPLSRISSPSFSHFVFLFLVFRFPLPLISLHRQNHRADPKKIPQSSPSDTVVSEPKHCDESLKTLWYLEANTVVFCLTHHSVLDQIPHCFLRVTSMPREGAVAGVRGRNKGWKEGK